MDTSVTNSLVGRLLDGRYRVESRIARGGMATVYRALDVRLDRLVAVKVMHEMYADDEEFVARFIREAKSAARLSHPNVVAVFDQGEDDGHVFLAMEYVAGRTLRELLRERGRLRPQEALAILQPVLAALGAAHQAGLVHRDVKPENVLLSDDGRVKVADFGLARAVASRTATSATTLIGTVAYLAPEQVTRGVADARSDVYAAGVMAFEMLTGRPPYDGETPISVAYKHANEDVPAPSTLVEGISADVDELVRRATARDPDQRPADAAAFLSAVVRVRRTLPALEADAGAATGLTPRLNQTLVVELPEAGIGPARGDDHEPPPPETTEEPRPRRRRRRGLIALLLVLLLAAGAGAAGWWYGVGRYTTVPSFLDMSVSQAQAKAAKAHLKVVADPEKQWNPAVGAGIIMKQSVSKGHQAQRGDTVTVIVSAGRHTATVPSLAPNESFDDYSAALKAAHFQIVQPVSTDYSDTVPANAVIKVDPAPGQVVDYGKAVVVTISQGQKPIAIPDVTGEPAAQAQKTLSDLGFQVTTSSDFSDTVKKDAVISQSKTGNGFKGDAIALVVSKGPELFKVPNVTSNMANPLSWTSIEQATKTLQDAGFQVKVGNTGRFGIVTHQDPKGGSMHPKGTVVTIDAS